MRMRTKKERKLLTNNKEHIGRKQDTFLQSRTSIHHRNGRVRSYHKSHIFTRRRTDNIPVKNHKSNRIELRNLRKENNNHHLNN